MRHAQSVAMVANKCAECIIEGHWAQAQVQVLHTGKCLDIWGGSGDDTADAIQYTCDRRKHQQFRTIPSGLEDGAFRLMARHSQKCFEVAVGGRQVHQMPCDSHNPRKLMRT